MWTELSGPEVGGREEEPRWNQVLYLKGTGMLRLNLNKAQGTLGAGWFACKNHLLSASLWQGFRLVLGLGTTALDISKNN